MLVRFGARRTSRALVVSLLATAIGCSSDDGTRITFSAGPVPLAFAAVQDGNEPWIAIAPSSDGTYSFRVAASTYGIITACGAGTEAVVAIMHATTAETTSPDFDCRPIVGPYGSLAGTLRGVPDGDSAFIHVANRGAQQPAGMFSLQTVPAGTWDLFAVRQHGEAPPFTHDRMIRRNDVTLTEGATTTTELDFDADGFAPESHVVSYEGGTPQQRTTVGTRLRNQPGGTHLALGPYFDGTFLALPASQLRDDDIHVVSVTAYAPGGASNRQMRRWFVAAQDFTATFPALPDAPIVSAEGGTPYLRMRAVVPASSDADRFDLIYRQRTPNEYTVWTVSLTREYVGGGGFEYTLPDLTHLAGWSASWGLAAALPVDWEFDTTSSDRAVGDLFDRAVPAERLDGRTDMITHQRSRFPR